MRTTTCPLVTLLLGLVLAAGAAHAQVAAPNLSPATGLLLGLGNPAVQSWEQSRVLGGIGQITVDDPGTPTLDPDADGDIKLVQGALVGEMFSIGGYSRGIQLDLDPLAGGGSLNVDHSRIAVAAMVSDRFSVGIGSDKEELSGTAIGNAETTTLLHAGLSLRVGDVLYLGGSYGNANLEVPTQNRDVEQAEYHAGAGARWESGDNVAHLEVYIGNRELAFDPVGPNSADEEDSQGFTAEVIWSQVLLGYESLTTDRSDEIGPTETEESSTFSVGWVPEQGLTVVLQLGAFELSDGTTGVVTQDNEFKTVAVGWLF